MFSKVTIRSKKNNEILTVYKFVDYFTIRVECCNFPNLYMDAKFFGKCPFKQFSPYIDATDRSKISSDQKRLFFAVSLYPLSFLANDPFKESVYRT